MPRGPTSLSVLLLASVACVDAHAAVRRCETPTGRVIYTDRECAAVGGSEQRRPPDAGPRVGASWTCARTVRDLAAELSGAIDSRDPNRLASLVHWTGMSTRAGYAVMGRIETLAERPLIGITPVAADVPVDPFGFALARAQRPPVGLRLQQMRVDGGSTASTVLGVTRHLGCWWLRF